MIDTVNGIADIAQAIAVGIAAAFCEGRRRRAALENIINHIYSVTDIELFIVVGVTR